MYHMYNSLSQKRKLSPVQAATARTDRTTSSNQDEIYFSHAIHDRKSKFLALFSSSPTYLASPGSLQAHSSLDGAMHRILGVRKRSSQQTLVPASRPRFSTDSDEDGEKWAGKRVEKVLDELGVEGVVVVGRWYGGVMLGPVRFQHIEDVVRSAVVAWAEDDDDDDDVRNEKNKKKAKVDDGKESRPENRERLISVLKERDQSVDVLRGLLEEKRLALAKMEKDDDAKDERVTSMTSPAKKIPDYQAMDVARLKSQEKARDATLAWILKQIEEVEKRMEAAEFEAFAKEVEANEDGVDEAGRVPPPASKVEEAEKDVAANEAQPKPTKEEASSG